MAAATSATAPPSEAASDAASSHRGLRLVVVGSTNPVKVNCVRSGFAKCFPGAEFEVLGCAAASGVPDQPFGDDETRRGALQRAWGSLEWARGEGREPEFVVGIEGGCAEEVVVLPGGREQRDMTCFAWIAVLHCASGVWGYARTGTFPLPSDVAALVRSGVELGVADDMIFKRTDSKKKDGSVGLLTRGLISRTTYYDHAMVLALVPFLHPSHYGAHAVEGSLGAAEDA